ncbi:MAG: hypothetical protein E6I93_04770 [Chloroflexi bacterium]|nr:MAG: hypothetical protein E6I93_04770 [Chloroflexota bacterium]TMF43457.1 MAG: hypothetical protein E6I32_16440 [Chloroflexota bacterium]
MPNKFYHTSSDDDESVRIKIPRYPTISSLRGAAGRLKRPLSWQQMRQVAYEDRFKAKRGEEA